MLFGLDFRLLIRFGYSVKSTNGDNWSWHKHNCNWKWNRKSLFRHNVKRLNNLMSVHVSCFDSLLSCPTSPKWIDFISKLIHTVDYKEANSNFLISTQKQIWCIFWQFLWDLQVSMCNAKRYWRKLTNT